jgi:APA family basic amino acid/polyamine antiporter
VAAFVYALFAVGGAGADAVFYGFLWLLAGLPVYVWVTRQKAGDGKQETARSTEL